MKTDSQLISGGVYQTILSDAPCRVIAFDDIEVFYDAYWPTLNKWSFSDNLKRQGTYYRTLPKIFLREATFLRGESLTTDELNTFRPDLLFRLCRNKFLTWTNELLPDFENFKKYASGFGCDFSNDIILPVTSITLRPFGSKGTITAKKSTLVSSLSDRGFTCIELLWLSHNIQAPFIKKETDKGVGIYRSGHEKKVPAYYIGGYYDEAGSIPKED
jgi:hypothetical protein